MQLSSTSKAPHWLEELLEQMAAGSGSAAQALDLAVDLGQQLPVPGGGETLLRWEALASLAASDLTAGRVAEAHLDALAILAEVGQHNPAGEVDQQLADLGVTTNASWGVFAAEGPGVKVTASETVRGWVLSGTKPWCSLAGQLSHALITAHAPLGRQLFAIALRQTGVTVKPVAWVSRGLVDVPSGPIDLDDVAAVPVGGPGWYLERPGFAWGGMGVAACWYGGAIGLARGYFSQLQQREPDQIAVMHLGAIDARLQSARALMAAAADAVDHGRADGSEGARWAARTRSVVADAAEDILLRVGHATGPAPLALNEEHARRVADLTVYLRQHHAERDQASLGRDLINTGDDTPW